MDRFDTLLFVAVSSEEEQLKKAAKEFGLSVQIQKGRFADYVDLGVVGRGRVAAIRTDMGPFGPGGSSAKAILCQLETQATSLISLGMAFGARPHEQEIGRSGFNPDFAVR